MDIVSFLGIIIGLAAIVGGNWLEGGHLDSLLNLSAFVIVSGGTLGATLVQTPPATLVHAIKTLKWLFWPPKLHPQAQVDKIIDWSRRARVEGLLSLEPLAEAETNIFTQHGLQLLIDGNDPEAIRDCMEVELNTREQQDLNTAQVFESMGGYAPTIGIIGAVMGLIHVMLNLGDPSKLGNGIATAFTSTLYGVSFANLIFLPIASKLKAHTEAITHSRELTITGMVSIAEGENPHHIKTKLASYLH